MATVIKDVIAEINPVLDSTNLSNCSRAVLSYPVSKNPNFTLRIVSDEGFSGSVTLRVRAMTATGCTQTGVYSKQSNMTRISGNDNDAIYETDIDLSDTPYEGDYRVSITTGGSVVSKDFDINVSDISSIPILLDSTSDQSLSAYTYGFNGLYFVGQSIQGVDAKVDRLVFRLANTSVPTSGYIEAVIYSDVTGTLGSTMRPVDADAPTVVSEKVFLPMPLGSAAQRVEFFFTGDNAITLSSSNNYVVGMRYVKDVYDEYMSVTVMSGGHGGNYTAKRTDQSTPTTIGSVDLYFEMWGLDSSSGGSGGLKVWTGSEFVLKPIKIWTGSSWLEKPLKHWTGAEWVAGGGGTAPESPYVAYFDGTSNAMSLPNTSNRLQPNEQFTWEMWFKLESYTQYNTLMGFSSNNYDFGRMDTTSSFRCHIYDSNSAQQFLNPSGMPPVNDGEWHHIAIMWDSVNGEKFALVDGVQRDVGTVPVGTELRDSTPLGSFYIGGSGLTARRINGWIKEVRYWQGPRTREEILHNMHRRLNGDEPNLFVYLPFNEGSGSTVIDKASGFEVDLGGATWADLS